MPSHFNVNKVILMGRLGNDPELRYTPSGQAKCSMSVATSHRYLDKQKNEWTEKTSWHRVVAWGKMGELCKEYLARGRRVFIEGRIDNRSYLGKDGQQKYAHEVVTDNVVFLEGRKDASAPAVPACQPMAAPPQLEPAPEEAAVEEELPF
jgi:single-strand DNA-binding protein